MRRHAILLVLLLAMALPLVAQALDTSTRPVGPVREWQAQELERFDNAGVHVKFVEGSTVDWDGLAFVDAGSLDLAPVNAALGQTELLAVSRTIDRDRATLRSWKAQGEARSGAVGPDLSLWYNLRVAGGRPAVAVLLNALNALDAVEIAHPAPMVEPAVLSPEQSLWARTMRDPQTPDYTGMQDYLYDTPVGLNAPGIWALPSGKGNGVKFLDVELGWIIDHEDFNPANLFYVGGAPMDPAYYDHGTAVLGEVIGWHNGFGVDGFAPDANFGVVAITESEWPDVPHYFQEAVDNLDAGDVWLIELQMYPPGRSATPMEWLQVNYDVIWTGCWSLGVVCIEAGANGSQDLDAAYWDGVFDRNLRDSGAIMVAAGTPTGRVAEWFTNWGTRMDVHAWGSSIVTTGYGDLQGGPPQVEYTSTFGGTSGASPMVTGGALCTQAAHKALYGYPLSPTDLRTLLNETGIPHLDGDQEIGPRPDLGAVADAINDLTAAPGSGSHAGFAIEQSPNPFREGTEFRFAVSAAGPARLSIYDLRGRRVRELLDRTGTGRLAWDGRNEKGAAASSGVYLYRLVVGQEIATGRMVKIR